MLFLSSPLNLGLSREGNIIQTQKYKISPIVDFMNSNSILNMEKYKKIMVSNTGPSPVLIYPHTHCTCYVVCSFILHMEGMYNIYTHISIYGILTLCSLYPLKKNNFFKKFSTSTSLISINSTYYPTSIVTPLYPMGRPHL